MSSGGPNYDAATSAPPINFKVLLSGTLAFTLALSYNNLASSYTNRWCGSNPHCAAVTQAALITLIVLLVAVGLNLAVHHGRRLVQRIPAGGQKSSTPFKPLVPVVAPW